MGIRDYRLQKRWTQTDLSYHSRVSASEISKIESGRLKPSLGQIERLARALGVRPEQINVGTSGK